MAQPNYLLDKLGRGRRCSDVDGDLLRYCWIQGARICGQQNVGRAWCGADDRLNAVSAHEEENRGVGSRPSLSYNLVMQYIVLPGAIMSSTGPGKTGVAVGHCSYRDSCRVFQL